MANVPNATVNLPASGNFTPAPAGAPHEVTVPGSERPTADQIAQARSNERVLSTYAPKPMTVAQMAAYLGKTEAEIQALRTGMVDEIKTVQDVMTPAPSPAAPPLMPAALPTPAAETPRLIPGVLVDPNGRPITSSVKGADSPLPSQDPNGLRAQARAAANPDVPGDVVVNRPDGDSRTAMTSLEESAGPVQLRQGTLTDAARAAHPRPPIDPAEPYQPAASDTDSPSRGIPQPITDKNKQITGGFGDLGEAQYFPLDGLELKQVVEKLLDAQKSRIQDDLRFSIAATYPRVRVRSVIEIECYAADHSFQIEKIMVPPHEKTPLDVAKQYGDKVVFCIVEQHLEMTDDGDSVTPPNAVRMELGMSIPRKHIVQLPGKQRMLVDV